MPGEIGEMMTYFRKATLVAGCLFTLVPFAVEAGNWKGNTADGIREAKVENDADNLIFVLCDVGVNAPITSVNFVVEGVSPLPDSNVRMEFDKDEPIFVKVDAEGGIGSLNAQDADMFDDVLAKLKAKSRVKVRLFDGSESTFRLSGSSKAIGQCPSDYSRYQIASN